MQNFLSNTRHRSVLSIVLLLASALIGCQSTPSKQAQIVSAHTMSPSNSSMMPANAPAPNWYAQQSIQPAGFYVGYGEATTLELAKSNARGDLAKQINSQIQVKLNQTTQVFSQDDVNQYSSKVLEEFSQAKLNDLVVLKSTQAGNRFYVSLGMDFRPLSERVNAQLGKLPKATQAHLFQYAPLWQELTRQYGFMPQLRLLSQDNRYYLKGNGQLLKLKNSDVPQIYPLRQSKQIEFELLPNTTHLKSDQLYKVKIQTQQAGYLSYLQVFQNGDLVVMFGNQNIKAAQSFTYPDPKLYDGLTAELPTQANKSQDLHIILLCPQPINLEQLENIGIQSNQKYSKNLQKLPGLVNNCDFYSQIIQIRK